MSFHDALQNYLNNGNNSYIDNMNSGFQLIKTKNKISKKEIIKEKEKKNTESLVTNRYEVLNHIYDKDGNFIGRPSKFK